jgi:hypothetical protein
MFQFDSVGIFGLISFATCWGLAGVLYRVGPPGSVARKLALLLFVEGVTLVTSGYIGLLMTPTVTASSWYQAYYQAETIAHTLGDCAFLALYPPFLAAALQTKLTRPFADKRMRIGLAGASIILFFAVQLSPLQFGSTLLYLMLSLLFGFALVASIQAWREATGAARDRARAFSLAFGLRDICWGFVYGVGIWQIWSRMFLTVDHDGAPSVGVVDAVSIVYALGTFSAVPLIAYGILRAHLFDIDLRIRWTIKQSTLATIVVTFVFLLSEGADRFLSAELGNYAGLLAAAVVVFFLAPLQRFAESVASVAMPNTKNTPEYTTFRKMQVYEDAVSEAHYEGGISEKERALLIRLRDSLGISEADADAIEGELTKLQPGIA